MYCPECGRPVDAGTGHCLNCGASLAVVASPEVPRPPAQDIDTYLVPAIIVLLCCCQPLGIVATVFAAMAHGEAKSGQYEAAYEHARQAKTWCWAGFIIGLVVYGAVVGLHILFAVWRTGF